MNKNKYLCIHCSHRYHTLEPFVGYVLIDGIKYIIHTRPPSKKVTCADCGHKTNHVFELSREIKSGQIETSIRR